MCRNSSGSTESLTGIPSAITGVRKGWEQEHAVPLSSENSASQLVALPDSGGGGGGAQEGCLCRPPRCEDDTGEYHRNRHGSSCSGGCDSEFATGSILRAGISTVGGAANSVTAITAARVPVRRGPKHALLSHAEQYRTLQPFLRRDLRNRRWRLVFSSDVHGTHLFDRCQRAFHEEEMQWHAVTAAAKLHHGMSGSPGVRRPADQGEEVAANTYVSSWPTASSALPLVPVLGLMETTLVVAAPKSATATSSATLNDVASSQEGGKAFMGAAVEHNKARSCTVVDSHVCIGLYLQHRPALGTVTSYRRSDVFFFLFLSPIQPPATAGDAGDDVVGASDQPPPPTPQPVATAPPPSVTQTHHRRDGGNDVADDSMSTLAPRDAGEESGGVRPTASLDDIWSKNTLAPAPVKEAAPPRTATHRLSNMPRQVNDSYANDYRAALEEERAEEEVGVFESSLPPPHLSSTRIQRESHRYDPNISEDLARTFDRHGTVVEERWRSQYGVPAAAAPAAAATEGGSGPHAASFEVRGVPPALNGVLFPHWQLGVKEMQRQHEVLQQQRGEDKGSSGGRTQTSYFCSPSPANVEADEEDTFSSVSAMRGLDEMHSTDRPHRSVTRQPPCLRYDPPSQISAIGGGNHASPFPAHANAAVTQQPHQDRTPPACDSVHGNAALSPTTPVSPRSTLELPATNGESVFTVTPLSVPRATTQSPTAFDIHPLYVHEAGNSLTMDDDLVSATTTVVSATSVPGGGLTWREDEDLSSYWPETPHISTGAAAKATNFHRRNSQRSQEWYSPANGPQMLSRASSFGVDDMTECLTPRLSGHTTTLVVPDAAERLPVGLAAGSGTSTVGTSPPLPSLPSKGCCSSSGGASLSPAVGSARPSAVLTPPPLKADVSSSGVTTSASPLATAAAAAPTPEQADGGGADGVHTAASAVRPVSTHIEVLPMTLWHGTPCGNGGASSSGEGALHSEVPSRSTSQLALTEGTIDVYCSITGALYVWDSHRQRSSVVPAGEEPTSSCEQELVYQRDASGVRWNAGYFRRNGDVADPALVSSSPSSPASTFSHGSLFSYVRAQARQSSTHVGSPLTSAASDHECGAAEVFTSSLVKMQLCVISARSMPTAFQRAPSTVADVAAAAVAPVQ
jgi:hypothetical protein